MNKRPFMAVNWLLNNQPKNNAIQSNTESIGYKATADEIPAVPGFAMPQPALPQQTADSNSFSISNYIIPQWKGESLITKDGLKLKKHIKALYAEAMVFAKSFSSRNKSTKLAVYNEFLNFAETENINISPITDYNLFWEHFSHQASPLKAEIQRFVNQYSLMAVNVYLLKLRFISLICANIQKSLSPTDLVNPDYIISKLFKKSSSTELVCESLKTNEFSWFRPSVELSQTAIEISCILRSISTLEFLKICNHEFPQEVNLHFQDSQNYSHSLSNRNFGLFINDLLIYLPEWLDNNKLETNSNGPKCINTLFTGDQLYSFALSHWLAQENNVFEKWSDVICPEFCSKGFQTGAYIKVYQELQFLTFLVHMAKVQNYEPVSLICKLYNQKNLKTGQDIEGQLAFFNTKSVSTTVYDRVVVNLSDLPKTNPHHYVLTTIQNYGEKLTNAGYLFVFSNQKLFVPSHSEKVEGLLKKYKLHASFDFDDLKGKGEIPKHLYVISKRVYNNNHDIFANSPKMQKESCLSFNFSGQLMHFSKFDLLRKEFFKFISIKDSINSPLYQKEPEAGLNFDFHQDAILNGKLLSNSNDSNNITHPNYFRNLTRTCVPFDQFFMVDQLTSKGETFTSELLGVAVRPEQMFQYLLIVNYTNEDDIRLELTTSDLFNVKSEEYGFAYFQYFGLTPKVMNLNINLFREYFDTAVGRQVVQLTFNGGLKKTKSKLKAMLIPRFFLKTEMIPTKHSFLELFTTDKNALRNVHPSDLKLKALDAIKNLNLISKNYPWHATCLLSHFKIILDEMMREIQMSKNEQKDINYQNPMIIKELISLEKSPLYPNHQDLYIEAKFSDRNDIYKRYTASQISKTEHGHCLNLYSDDKIVLVVHGEFEILHFLNFILQNAFNATFAQILQNIELPKLSDLREVISKFNEVEDVISDIFKASTQSLNGVIVGQIFN